MKNGLLGNFPCKDINQNPYQNPNNNVIELDKIMNKFIWKK